MLRPTQPIIKGFNQSSIISKANQYLYHTPFKMEGEQLDTSGVCCGLTSRYLLHKGKGKEDQYFLGLTQILTAAESQDPKQTELFGKFITNVSVLQDPQRYNKNRRQGDLGNLGNLGKEDLVIKTQEFIGRMKVTDVENFFADTIKDNEMIFLASTGHAIGAYKKFNTYYCYNPSSDDGELAFNNLSHLTKYVMDALSVSPSDMTVDLQLASYKYQSKINKENPEKYSSTEELTKKYITKESDPKLYFSLAQAAKFNFIEEVKVLLEQGADPYQAEWNNKSFPNGPAFFYAAVHGCVEVVDLFTNKRLPTIKEILRVLQIETDGPNEEMASKLIALLPQEAKIKHAKDIFLAACAHGYPKILEQVMVLTQLPSDVIKEGMEKAIKKDRKNIFDLLQKKPLFNSMSSSNDYTKLAIESNSNAVFLEIYKTATFKREYIDLAIKNKTSLLITKILLENKPDTYLSLAQLDAAIRSNSKDCLDILLRNDKYFSDMERPSVNEVKKSLNWSSIFISCCKTYY